ncbi:unnamed protein product [Lactuca saligna]|uniref:Uncharacterized protein n=1 Tax=Lactuca saligna TaxID=75948 RepID=A0AA36E2D9_LACSI|nr:unnamed protein product [Lactuca saligna]
MIILNENFILKFTVLHPETPEVDLLKESSIPEDISVIPPEVLHVKSSIEETRTSDVSLDVSHMDTNVNMGKEGAETDAQGNPNVTSNIIVSLPPVTSTTDLPTFHNIINTPFTSIFSSQSTDPPKPTSPVDDTMMLENETDNEGFGGTFEDLKFDEEEENFPDHMLMTMTQ